ncbi:MAG: glycerol uptake facilitator protein [Thermoleophilaceae bacterium]|nr:glycerol uptake facilitator protein [Thermoleophilaceae bacterium]
MHTRKTAYAAEFLGTFLLVLFIGLILASNSNAGLGTTNFAVIGLLHAFVLAMLIASLGAVSSAHFNPAVTIALRSLRKISATDAAIYIVAQLAGAVCAALVVKLVLTNPADVTNYGAPAVNKTFVSGNAGAAAAELIGTFVLVWAILATAVNPRGDHAWAPWMIGATLGLAVMAIGPITGAGLNPARAFGPALVANAFGGAGSFLLVYVLAPIAGALLAGVGYRLIVLERRSEVRSAELVQEPFEEFALAN